MVTQKINLIKKFSKVLVKDMLKVYNEVALIVKTKVQSTTN